MPANEYIQSMVNRTARPRSERLRKLGGAVIAGSSASTPGSGYNYVGDSHSHANLADLNRLSVNDGYIFLTDETVDPDTGDVLRDLTKASAGYADRALSNAAGHELNWFIPMEVGGELTLKLNPIYSGLWAEGWLADGGVGSAGGGGGGSSTLYGLNDVDIPQPPSAANTNDVLSYNGTKWTNVAKSTFLSDYYTKAQVDQLLSAINQFDYVTAQTLPTAGIGTMYKIYLVPSANPETRNVKDEFITLFDGTNYSWERIGSTEIDLTGYVTTQGLNTALANYALISSLAAVATSGNYNDLSNKPATLPNPQALAFGNDSYDGSAEKTITAASLGAVTSVSLSAGSVNGTLKLTVNGTAGDNVSVPGLGSLAYKSSLLASDIPNLSGTYLKYLGGLGHSDNFNDKTFGSWVYANEPVNFPAGAGGGQLLALGTGDNQTGQAQVAINTSGVPYFRIKWENTWSAWREALVSGVTQSIAGAKTFSDNMTLGGNLSMANNKHIDLGPIRLEYYNTGSANALRVTANDGSTVNVVVDGWISDGGIGSGSGNGGLITSVKSISSLGTAIAVESLTETFSAKAIESIYEAVQGKQPLITATNKLDYSLLSNTPAIPTVPTNVSAFTNDAGYITGNQTITLSGDVSGSGTTSIAVSIGSGKVTNAMLAGSIENSKLNTIGVTKGGTGLTSISKGAILYGSASNTMSALSANGTSTKKFLSQTSDNAPAWSALAASDIPNLNASKITEGTLDSARLPSMYIGKTAVKFSNANNDTLVGISGFTSAASASASNDTSLVVWEPNGGGTGVGVWHFRGNIVADGWIADGGIGSGSGGNAGTLADLNDVTLSSLANGDVLTYNSSSNHWVNTAKATFLSGYATQTWVGNQGYLTSSALSGYATQNWVSQQGYLTADDLADDEHDIAAGKLYLGDGWLEGDTYPLTQKPRPAWKYRNGLTTVTDFVAMVSDIPSTLDDVADGSTRKLADYLPLSGGTMTGNIILDGTKILPSGDAVSGGTGLGYLGESNKRFRQGHIRDLYTSYFIFRHGEDRYDMGSISYNPGCFMVFSVNDRADTENVKTFYYKFYVNSNSNGFFYEEGNGVNIPLGKSDHRWSTIYGINGNFSGNLSLAQTSQITLGPVTITYDATNKALHISGTDNGQTIGIYCDGWIADGGIQQTS